MTAFVMNHVRRGFYLDSVALMRLSREIGSLPGIEEAALMMATPSNRAILHEAGLMRVDGPAVQSNDLLVALRAVTEEAARFALDVARQALDQPKSQSDGDANWRPRSIAAAVKQLPGANLALISVPGDFAAAEARKALRQGLNVMMFSDNVTLEDERSLKQEAGALGLLMMGPDCGTAILGGAPLAFANRVNRGSIGIVGASGTGMQEVSCLISEAGGGISHAIGVGGRDLKREIGGITTLVAIDALDADPGTKHVVLISKPPHPEVAEKVVARIGRSDKPFTVCFIGAGRIVLPPNAVLARTLKNAAEAAIGRKLNNRAVGLADYSSDAGKRLRQGRRVEGLFSGGTLCAEAQVILTDAGRQVVSNAAIPASRELSWNKGSKCDRVIDLGADDFTRGRPHPMIDPSVRDVALHTAFSDRGVGVILLDLVIGYGAHADPAGHLACVLSARTSHEPLVVGSVTGTELDPQVRSRQARRLSEAGVLVAPSNAEACELALKIVR